MEYMYNVWGYEFSDQQGTTSIHVRRDIKKKGGITWNLLGIDLPMSIKMSQMANRTCVGLESSEAR